MTALTELSQCVATLVTLFATILASNNVNECHSSSCLDNTSSLSMLQVRSVTTLKQFQTVRMFEEAGRAEAARFLLHATFGPTSTAVTELQAMQHEDWIQAQMDLPVESHREFYRRLMNTPYVELEQVAFNSRSPCAKGSRWHRNTFFRSFDEKKQVKIYDDVNGHRVLEVGNQFRTHLNQSLPTVATCSNIAPSGMSCTKTRTLKTNCKTTSWSMVRWCRQGCFDIGQPYEGDNCRFLGPDLDGYTVCEVQPQVGGLVALSPQSKCHSQGMYVWFRHPGVHLENSSLARDSTMSFERIPELPDVLFKERHSADSCELATTNFTKVDGQVYRHDARVKLETNTVDQPSLSHMGCVRRSPFNYKTCKVQPQGARCDALACGSQGEVANEPTQRHIVNMNMAEEKGTRNSMFTSSSDRRIVIYPELARSWVWTTKALRAQDQLRQRTAWALSQIIVAAPGEISNLYKHSECWVNFYDIFVRNAFGSYRDILREVTFSPLMGAYLTYEGNVFQEDGTSYPDENYAREIMQLFTIGLVRLHPNGTVMRRDGKDIPTYTNEDIMNVARVFTGLHRKKDRRSNIERTGKNNWIDPMYVDHRDHNRYPKPDTLGGYLGDGYPLCEDLPKGAFLTEGSEYEWVGHESDSSCMLVNGSSELYGSLCNETDGSCNFASYVALSSDLQCTGSECTADSIDVVKVQGSNGEVAYYAYKPKACVHFYFGSNSALVVDPPFEPRSKTCSNPNLPTAGFGCCSGCKDSRPRVLEKKDMSCEEAKSRWTKKGKSLLFLHCNKNYEWRENEYCALTCSSIGLGYSGLNCSAGPYREALFGKHGLFRKSSAEAQCSLRGMSLCNGKIIKGIAKRDACQVSLWISNTTCNEKLQVHGDGKVSGSTENPDRNRFAAVWSNGTAPEKLYDMTVQLRPVFAEVPNDVKLIRSLLKIGAYAPSMTKINCTANISDAIKIYASDHGVESVDTIIEVQGRFYKNAESKVLVGDSHSIRNPPVFLWPLRRKDSDRLRAAAVVHEIFSLIDHLITHPNTATFLGKKLIQRFTTSNPDAEYLEAVSNAFTTGWYGDREYGTTASLAAAVAAILLHPVARPFSAATDGLLREPMLKAMHLLRSMEYRGQEDPVFQKLQDKIGQFPYESPTVFNFFDAEYQPPAFQEEPEPEPEPEAEEEPAPEPLVGPEFQILTPPWTMGFLNGMTNIVDEGMGSPFGFDDGEAGLTHADKGTARATVEDLDVLLTGGRLTPAAGELARAAYEQAPGGQKLKAAQETVLLTPEFNTLGDPKPNGTRETRQSSNVNGTGDYKAMVFLFLAGGADTYHMLVPINCPLYEQYRSLRGNLHHNQSQVAEINATSQESHTGCSTFGIHPELTFLHDLYKEPHKQAAFISNVGTLASPWTAESPSVVHCGGMYSHSHQQVFAQTLHCQVPGAAPRGGGGRMADVLAKTWKTTSFSIAGTSTWSLGYDTHTEIIHSRYGSVTFGKHQKHKDTIENITSRKYDNIFCDEYASLLGEAANSSEELDSALKNVRSQWTPQSDVSHQLHQVARLIATREDRGADRDIFFVQHGGFDTHRDMAGRLGERFRELNLALAEFVRSLKKQKVGHGTVFDSVVLLTESDFGRTLTPNGGGGTDHGWGGNHFIIGGALNGGHIFNEYLSSFTQENNENLADSRGRVKPKFPWESVLAPVAEWMGVPDALEIFPNLKYFNRSTHIISKDDLFKTL